MAIRNLTEALNVAPPAYQNTGQARPPAKGTPQTPTVTKPKAAATTPTAGNTLELQRKLKDLGYYSGELDNSYGPLTKAAVSKYQADNKLQVDGSAGPITTAHLNNTYSNFNKAPAPVVSNNQASPVVKEEVKTENNGVNFDSDPSSIINEVAKLINDTKTTFDPKAMFDQIMGTFSDVKVRDKMSYEEALNMAKNQLDPLYENAQTDLLKALSVNQRKRGVYGQLAADTQTNQEVRSLTNQQSSDKAALANQLLQADKADAQNEAAHYTNERAAKLNTLIGALNAAGALDKMSMDNLFKLLEFKVENENDEFTKKVTLAEVTGVYDGSPTVAYKKLLHDMKMDNNTIALKAKDLDDSIAQGWERISLDKEKHALDNKKYTLNAEEEDRIRVSSFNNYTKDITSKAFDMAYKYFNTGSGFSIQDVDPAEFDKVYKGYVNTLVGATETTEPNY